MIEAARVNWVLVLLVSASAGTFACNNNSPSGQRNSAGAGGENGGNGGGSGGGSGGQGGAGGSTSGSASNAGGTGGGSGGSGGDATGGAAGGAAGNSAASGGASGRTGGSGGAAGGAGGAAGGSGGNAAGGSGGTAGNRDASADGPRAGGAGGNRQDVGPDLGSTNTPDTTGTDATCPSGQALCGGTCIDVTATSAHCGACDIACAASQACIAGTCVEGGSSDGDGCTSDLARNLTLQQIAVYQSVKIPVMQDGAEVAATDRNASVVEGRNTLFRVFVTLGSGWVTRDLAARLTLTPADGSAAQYYSKKSLSASSVDSNLATTFQIFVPPSAMADSLRYSVEVVECSTQSGSAGQARFPASGDIDLGVKTTGGLKIKIIPIEVDNLLPDTSSDALAGYADEMTAMYPIDAISITVGDTLTTTSPLDWSGMLDQLRSKRSSDKPAADVYYFGLVKPASTLRAYCQSSCTTGIGFVVTSATGNQSAAGRAAVGVGFADKASYETMAHEVGHNHGRNHSPCSTAGTITGVDPNYPYANGVIGSWGYDARTQLLFDPTKITDIMGYCNNKWISDYTYDGITTRVAAVNGVAMVYTPAYALGRWRVMLVDERGPRWGIPITDQEPASGDPEAAIIYDSSGAALTSATVYRTAIADVPGSMYMVPEPQPGWYAVAVADAPPLPFATSQ